MDAQIVIWIQNFRNPLFDFFFKTLTRLGDHAELWIAIILIFACFKKTRKAAFIATIALVLEVVLVSGIMKPLIMRPRPFVTYPEVEMIIPYPSGSSFPSGHAASSIAVAFVLYFNKVRFRKTIMILALLMAFSRVYLFVHYPSDILFGTFTGIAIAMLLKKYQSEIVYKTKQIYKKLQSSTS